MQHNSIDELPREDRPYEKFLRFGPQALTDTELLAILLQSGTRNLSSLELARKVLLIREDISVLSLYEKSFEDLKRLPGIGRVKAIRLKCVAELATRIHRARRTDTAVFTSPRTVADYYMESMRHLDHEQLTAVYLDGGCKKIADEVIFVGSVNHTLISAREIFLKALEVHAVYVMLIHNHPSGNASPSKDDIAITQQICMAGEILNIPLLDHLIIGDREYVSFKESGYFHQ
ncbi:MAG: DNA repair protein RadC [Lachnospiraceae bacterium]|nr:DNA repair protein RadC [Lachnospiraceae bacterium]